MKTALLVGSPNSGKTSLFNWLTGRSQKVVNYPGSTVDIASGTVLSHWADGIAVVDSPGSYSLFPKSQEEEVTSQLLFSGKDRFDKIILVMDSTQINRQWHLLTQLKEAGASVIIALSMHDLHRKEGSEVNVRLLEALAGVPVCPIDGRLGGGMKELVERLKLQPASPQELCPLKPWTQERMKEVFSEGDRVANQVTQKKLQIFQRTKSIDRVLLHPVWGVFIFLTAMVLFFSSIYWAAAPLMDLVDLMFAQVMDFASSSLPEGLFKGFLVDGLIGGTGAVLVFVPQILILFLAISFLEDTGYLARAATLVDRPLSWMGLNGKSFVPLLSGFACAVPALMAARSINSEKERWIAMFIIPFMTCSARLPVYALLIGFLYRDQPFKAGMMLTALYGGAILVGALSAYFLSKIVKFQRTSFFLQELPIYRWPRLSTVIRQSVLRTKSYIVRTGPIILFLTVVIWVLTTFPNYNESDEVVRLESSYASGLGRSLEPIFKPMGADWRVGVGLISAFAAREVFVSAIAVMFHVTDAGAEADSDEDADANAGSDDAMTATLLSKMREAQWPDGSPLFTMASVMALLVFFLIALQCISTSAMALQESGSWRFVVGQLVGMNLLAYISAVLVYNILI